VGWGISINNNQRPRSETKKKVKRRTRPIIISLKRLLGWKSGSYVVILYFILLFLCGTQSWLLSVR